MHPFAQTSVRGFKIGECISALQKAIRRCDEKQTVCWAVEIDQSGHGSMLWNRFLIIASEDIGIADPTLPANLRALYENWKDAKARRNPMMPERLFTMHAAILLARAPKSRYVDNAIWASYGHSEPLVDAIPDYALDTHTGHRRADNPDGRPDQSSYYVENEATDLWEGDGPNPWYLRKEKFRDEHGWAASKEWFNKQGSGPGARSRAYDQPVQETLV